MTPTERKILKALRSARGIEGSHDGLFAFGVRTAPGGDRSIRDKLLKLTRDIWASLDASIAECVACGGPEAGE